MRVLLVGSAGQLGRALQQRMPAGTTLVTPGHVDMDLGDAAAVDREVRCIQPELVINAAAYTQVDLAESEVDRAFQVNADGPRHLSRSASAVGARLIQISTDFVFSGDQPEPYETNAPTAPLNVYGHSKLAGEQAVLETPGSQAAVVRTSWLYAWEGRNFVNTMLGLMRTRDSLAVVVDQVGSPTWAGSLAGAIWEIAARPEICGLQHWSDSGVASWYDFAVAIQEEALARGLLDRCIPIRAIRSCDFPTPARRPRYSVLDTRQTAAALGYQPSHWRQSLRSMLDEHIAS